MISQPKQIRFSVNYNNKIYHIGSYINQSLGQLLELIFSKLDIDIFNYTLHYKALQITLTDERPLYAIFGNEPSPYLIINKNTPLTNEDNNPSITNAINYSTNPKIITVKTSMSKEEFLMELGRFFKGRKIPYNAIVNQKENESYEIAFKNSELVREYIVYRKTNDKIMSTSSNDYKSLTPVKSKHHLPVISYRNPQSQYQQYSQVRHKKKNQRFRSVDYDNKKEKRLEKILLDNHTNNEKTIERLSKNRSVSNGYCGSSSQVYMTIEERKRKEEFEDKIHWMDKKGFIKSVGNYSMKPKYIPNYVGKTPNDPILCYQFRHVNKLKWINKKGFMLA